MWVAAWQATMKVMAITVKTMKVDVGPYRSSMNGCPFIQWMVANARFPNASRPVMQPNDRAEYATTHDQRSATLANAVPLLPIWPVADREGYDRNKHVPTGDLVDLQRAEELRRREHGALGRGVVAERQVG